jgi:hypothetical protein
MSLAVRSDAIGERTRLAHMMRRKVSSWIRRYSYVKWYFALNEASFSSAPDLWEPMILAALSSARAHTRLEPHLIWDGSAHPFLDRLHTLGVEIVRHRVTFYDALAAYYPDDGHLRIASGAFLRTEIPLLENDESVIYTDCDVMFTAGFNGNIELPKIFSCAPEFDRDDYALFNTGVMIMNIKALRETLPGFRDFICHNLSRFDTFDQDAYRQFYGDQLDKLRLTLNWKPYWGVSSDAEIVHFHGPKPSFALHLLENPDDMSIPSLNTMFHWNVNAYKYYTDEWLSNVPL